MEIVKYYKKTGKYKGCHDRDTKLKIAKTDIVYFKCENCGIETNKEKRRVNEKYPYCQKCLRKIKLKERYGVENVFQLDDIKEKSRLTKKEKYGDENFSNTEKRKNTLIKRYNVDSPLKLNKTKERRKEIGFKESFKKAKDTNIEKYGVENVFQMKEFQEKQKKTLIKRYNVDSPLKNESLLLKQKNTMVKKYGQNYPKILSRNCYFEVIDRVKNVEPLFSDEEYDNVKKKYKWKCLFCGNEFIDGINNGKNPMCPKCKKAIKSKPEIDISDYIKSLGFSVDINNRKLIYPYEIDIIIPEKGIGIEFNGLYWHSEQMLNETNRDGKKYHLMKTDLANEKGIRLIHIFEDEWLYKSDIVKLRLRSILGKNERRIGGREIEVIKEILPRFKNDFLDKYHIQGKDTSSLKLGAFKNDELVSVMTFAKPRISLGQKVREEGVWELSRFASISNTQTPGVASKLFKYFIKQYNPETIYTYSDIRWNTGRLYKQLDMEYLGRSNPNYWYIENDRTRSHRFKYRKQRLKNLLEDFNPDLTEYENMLYNGFDRVWDCGNDKWIWRK